MPTWDSTVFPGWNWRYASLKFRRLTASRRVLTFFADAMVCNDEAMARALRPFRPIPVKLLPLGYPVDAIGRGKKQRKPLGEVASRERYGQPFA